MSAHKKRQHAFENNLPSQMLALEPRYLFDAAVVTTVADVASAPADTPAPDVASASHDIEDGQVFAIFENAPAGTQADEFESTGSGVVLGDGIINATDPDSLQIIGGSGATAFELVNGEIRVLDPSQLDHETNEVLELIVESTGDGYGGDGYDGDGYGGDGYGGDSTIIQVQILDVSPEPLHFNGEVSDETIQAGNTLTKNIAAEAMPVDDDGDAIRYELVGEPTGASIDPMTGAFTWDVGLEQTGITTITVKVSSDFTTSLQFDVDATPQVFAIFENAPAGTQADEFESTGSSVVLGDGVINTHADPSTLQIVGGNGATAFELVNGEIRVLDPSQLDHETNAVLELIVESTDGDPASATNSLVQVLDVSPEPLHFN